MNKNSRVALVTGGQRGLGLETCRALGRLGYTVLLTSPVLSAGRAAARLLAKDGLDVHFHALDVTSDGAVKDIKQFVRREFGRAFCAKGR
jgi:NAD(P)-dependent dehydrogenase (short-subunit alcohol dehydrogenase family)